MRVTQCCCGCSLKTGTLILLWLDLISQASSVIKAAVAACSSERSGFTFLDSAGLGWGCIVLVIVIYGLVGVDKHRPSYLLPYIGTYIFSLVCLVLFTLILWVGSVAMRDEIIDMLKNRFAMTKINGQELSSDEIGRAYNDAVSSLTVALVVVIALYFYFFTVVYSYYKQMQEEDKGIYTPPTGTGIVYSAPATQVKGYDSPPPYAQQPAVAPYPQQNVGYPQLPQNVGYPQQQYPSYPPKQ